MNATAAVFLQPGQPLEIRQLSLPSLAPGEALVEIELCTVCGSDLHSVRGDRQVPSPSILGHEIVGSLKETNGDIFDLNGERLTIGDRVSWSIAASCGQCFFCREGIPQKCTQLFKYGHQALSDHPLGGGLASHCHLARGTSLVRVPPSLPAEVACPANCATATAAAALRSAGTISGRTVLIYGAGMLGLTAAAMARELGAPHVFVSDLNTARCSLAERFGATPSLELLREATQGRGADIAIDMSGSPAAMEDALSQLRIGGCLVLVGAVFPARPLSLPADQLVRNLHRIEGVHNYTPADLQAALDFLSANWERYPFADLVEREFPLTEINEAIKVALEDSPIRVALRP